MKTSLITTIFNEEEGIGESLESIVGQTKLADEVVIIDGGSTDNTVALVKTFIRENKSKSAIKFSEKRGNRSVGRNEAIKRASGEIILITDAGCLLDRKWVEEMVKPFADPSVDVVAGYYKGKAETVFQKCLIPYVLVMPDRVDPRTFLPATRSMAIRKHVWEELEGFDEELSHNEDYAFAQKIKREKKKIVFTNKAIVDWIPRDTFKEAYTMFYRFAYGDAEARIYRPKVFLLFARYAIGIFLVILAIIAQEKLLLLALLIAGVVYLTWAAAKNYHYVRHWEALFLLPALQLTADVAVMNGTIRGIREKWGTKKTS